MSSSILVNCRHCENGPIVSHINGTSQEKAQFSRIDVSVECMHHDTPSLLQQRAAARKRNDLLLAVSTPTEILVTIFEFACCPDEEYDKSRFITDIRADFWLMKSVNFNAASRLGPFFISRVCSVWRHVALGTPQLLNSIKLAVNYRSSKKQAALLQYWLLNAGQYPLTVGLTDHSFFEQEQDESPTGVIDVLAPYAHRLQTAELTIVSKWVSALIHIGKHASSLCSLTLHKSCGSHPIAYVAFFAGAPKLCDVTLFGYSITEVLLPSTQIERLHADTVDEIDPIGSLRQHPKLKYCKLDTEYCEHRLSNISIPLMHNTLSSFELRLKEHMDLIVILNEMTLPSLRCFTLYLYSAFPPMTSLLSFFSRSSCALETLHLDGMAISDIDVIACLQALPGLRNFWLEPIFDYTLHNAALSWRVLHSMNPRKYTNKMVRTMADEPKHSRQCLVPNLESLYYCGNIQFNQHMLVEFLESRWDGQHITEGSAAPIARLRSVRIITSPMNFNEEHTLVLCRLRQEGMQVQIVGKSVYSTNWIV